MASDKTFGGCHGRNGRSNRRCNARLPQGCSENTPAGGMNLTASNAEIRFPPSGCTQHRLLARGFKVT